MGHAGSFEGHLKVILVILVILTFCGKRAIKQPKKNLNRVFAPPPPTSHIIFHHPSPPHQSHPAAARREGKQLQ